MSRISRKADQRIANPATHQPRWVSFTVAAIFLKMDRRALNAYADEGRICYEWRGRRRKVHVDEVLRFQGWLQARARRAS